MLWMLTPLGDRVLDRRELEIDKEECRKIGSCGVGKKALYLGGRFVSRRYYLPWTDVRRVFKRVAMSPGGFSGKGVFGSMAYLVVQYGNGAEKQFRFRTEAEVDTLLSLVGRERPDIPTQSAAAAKKLAEAEAEEKKRFLAELSPAGETARGELTEAKAFLERKPEIGRTLTAAAKQKRIVDAMKPWVLAMGALMTVGGMALAVFGVFSLLGSSQLGWYLLLAGGALFFFAQSAGIAPGRWTSKKRAQKDWDEAVASAKAYIGEDFPVPARYAHPTVLERMIRVVREGRAEDPSKALETVKADLRALNSSVTVSQKEHDEVVEVKPLFLVSDYE